MTSDKAHKSLNIKHFGRAVHLSHLRAVRPRQPRALAAFSAADVRALMSVRIIDRHELHTGIHQGRYECQVPGQAVELGNDELGFLLLQAARAFTNA